MEHTPGPWEISGGTNSKRSLFVWRKEEPGFIEPHGIATVHGELAEVKANARLIAAAPDLLEACRGLLMDTRHRHKYHGPMKCDRCEAYQAARAALAKAEGGVRWNANRV